MNLITKAQIEVNAVYKKNARTMNVVAMLEGIDEKLKEEVSNNRCSLRSRWIASWLVVSWGK